MKKLKSNLQLSKLKGTAMRLRANYQIPYYLCYLIRNLSIDSSELLLASLKRDSEHYLRIKGYYKMYPIIEKEYNDVLKQKYSGLERG